MFYTNKKIRVKNKHLSIKKTFIDKKKIFSIAIIFTVLTIFVSYNVFFRNNEVYGLSKYGSRGEEVRQIQTKLKRWGYYKGNIDGIFGSGTLEAVKWFQRKNGLQVDGIAGKKTLEAMGIFNSSSSSSNSSVSTNSNDVNLLARVIYGEADKCWTPTRHTRRPAPARRKGLQDRAPRLPSRPPGRGIWQAPATSLP